MIADPVFGIGTPRGQLIVTEAFTSLDLPAMEIGLLYFPSGLYEVSKGVYVK
jgi:hypothetical protein